MNGDEIISDQFNNWSESSEETFEFHTPTSSPGTAASVASSRAHPSRFAHRTLQALWQARLQVCRGTWPWPKVLSLRHSKARKAADGLRTFGLPRRRDAVPGKLSFSAQGSRRDLRDQPRAPTSKRKAIGRQRGRFHGTTLRSASGSNPRGQYALLVTGNVSGGDQ